MPFVCSLFLSLSPFLPFSLCICLRVDSFDLNIHNWQFSGYFFIFSHWTRWYDKMPSIDAKWWKLSQSAHSTISLCPELIKFAEFIYRSRYIYIQWRRNALEISNRNWIGRKRHIHTISDDILNFISDVIKWNFLISTFYAHTHIDRSISVLYSVVAPFDFFTIQFVSICQQSHRSNVT